MKRICTKILLVGISCFFLANVCTGQKKAQAEEKAVISWIQQHAMPLRHVEAGNGFADLQPLKQVLKDVRVVGLGESTHGTREMFQVKHRLLEFLVKEMGYNAFALEASYAACQTINEYVLYGKGDLGTALTGQGYVVWDTEEMREMIEWLRVYNQGMPEAKRVKFYGLDISNNDIGRREILRYLRKVAPEKVTSTDSLFRMFDNEERKWPTKIDAEAQTTLLRILPPLQELIHSLTTKKDMLVRKSSSEAFDQALKYAEVMKRFIQANVSALKPPFAEGSPIRSLSMAENLIYLVEREGPNAKFIVSEHNSHLAQDTWNGLNIMGYQLRKKYGDEYYVLSIEFNQGAFHTRTAIPDKLLGDLKEVTLPPAPVGSFPWYLNRAKVGNLILDLRNTKANSVVNQWLNATHKVYLAGWVFWETDYVQEVGIKRQYDGVIFIDKTTAARPTANALKTVARREGL